MLGFGRARQGEEIQLSMYEQILILKVGLYFVFQGKRKKNVIL